MQNAYRQSFLTADANHPLITSGSFKTEALLYNLDANAQQAVREAFFRICNKQLDPSTLVTGFSGGERVIMMALLTLYCPAPRLCFIDLWHALDPGKHILLQELLSCSPKEIIMEDSQC